MDKYPGLLGVKNGYTSNAGNTLIAAARRDGRTLLVTVMNPQSGGGFEVYEEARELLDWGFAASGKVDPVGSLPAHDQAVPAGPAGAPVAASLPSSRSRWADAVDGLGWSGAAAIAGTAVLGAAAVALVLRGKLSDAGS